MENQMKIVVSYKINQQNMPKQMTKNYLKKDVIA